MKFVGRTLVGCFNSKVVGDVAMRRWMVENWKSSLGSVLEAHILVRGWMCFILKSKDDCGAILSRN
jgi:hypothetical protein